MPITLMLCYARSGGTLLNRCLGSLPDVVILSEVNPGRRPGNMNTVKEQAKAWYDITLSSDDFSEGVLELASLCTEQNKHLVVRAWPVFDFVPSRQNQFQPGGALSAYQALQGRTDLKTFALVRDSIDIWISNGCKPDFFRHYRGYTEQLVEEGIPTFQYEQFCNNPRDVMRDICSLGELPYSETFLDFASFSRAHGDVQLGSRSRGGRSSRIDVLPRRRIARQSIDWVNQCEDMARANQLTGYPPRYDGRALEAWYHGILGRLHARLAKRG